jgi:hypothetical protein
MPKIFVDVHTPGNGKTYEFQLDSDMSVEQAKAQIVQEILTLENNGISLKIQTVTLGDVTGKQKPPEHLSLWAAGIRSGHNLILV